MTIRIHEARKAAILLRDGDDLSGGFRLGCRMVLRDFLAQNIFHPRRSHLEWLQIAASQRNAGHRQEAMAALRYARDSRAHLGEHPIPA